MIRSFLSFAALGLLASQALAAPKPATKRWQDWDQCTSENQLVRVSFTKMPAWQRKEYTDAIKVGGAVSIAEA